MRELPDLPSGDRVWPIVLFTSASYLKTDGQDMPVFDSCLAMALWVRKWAAGSVLGESERSQIVAAIKDAKPADRTVLSNGHAVAREMPKARVSVEKGTTRQGTRFVRVRGTKMEAEDLN